MRSIRLSFFFHCPLSLYSEGTVSLTYYSIRTTDFEKLVIDRKAGEIIRLIASVCLFACLFACLFVCPSSPVWTVWAMTGQQLKMLSRLSMTWLAKHSKRASETLVSYTLKKIIECSSQGAFKKVGRSKWLLFWQVAPSRLITLLIWNCYCIHSGYLNTYSAQKKETFRPETGKIIFFLSMWTKSFLHHMGQNLRFVTQKVWLFAVGGKFWPSSGAESFFFLPLYTKLTGLNRNLFPKIFDFPCEMHSLSTLCISCIVWFIKQCMIIAYF